MRLIPVVLIGVAVLTASCSASTSDDGPKLRAVTDGGEVGITYPGTKLGVSLVQPLRPLCTTGKPVTITSVTAMEPTGGMRITSWATRYVGPDFDGPVEEGGVGGRADLVDGFGHHPVSVRCGPRSTGPDADLAMQFDVSFAAGSPRGTMTGVLVRYGDRRTEVQYAVAVCTAKDCPAP